MLGLLGVKDVVVVAGDRDHAGDETPLVVVPAQPRILAVDVDFGDAGVDNGNVLGRLEQNNRRGVDLAHVAVRHLALPRGRCPLLVHHVDGVLEAAQHAGLGLLLRVICPLNDVLDHGGWRGFALERADGVDHDESDDPQLVVLDGFLVGGQVVGDLDRDQAAERPAAENDLAAVGDGLLDEAQVVARQFGNATLPRLTGLIAGVGDAEDGAVEVAEGVI